MCSSLRMVLRKPASMFRIITCFAAVGFGALVLTWCGSRGYPAVYYQQPASGLWLGETHYNHPEPQWNKNTMLSNSEAASVRNRSKNISGTLSPEPKRRINSVAVSVADNQKQHMTTTLPLSIPAQVSAFSTASPSIRAVTMLKAGENTGSSFTSILKGQGNDLVPSQLQSSHSGTQMQSQQPVGTHDADQQIQHLVNKAPLVGNGRTDNRPLDAAVPAKQIPNAHSSGLTERGYVLAANYYEQQSMGSRNMFLLQCWAQRLDLLVVKPVMKGSKLMTPLDNQEQRTMLKFEDSFNLTEWNQRSQMLNHAPLVEWGEFLRKAPRKVVLVKFEHPSVSLLKSRRKAGEGILHQPEGDRYKSGCRSKWPSKADLSFMTSKGFKVVRNICFNFFFGDELSVEEFHQHLLGDLVAKEVTIIFEIWRGLGSPQRVLVKNACPGSFPIQEYISPSEKLLQDASRYIRAYLSGGAYMAVMGRLEMPLVTMHKKFPVVPFCLEETLSQWKLFQEETHLEKTFLSIDIGKYGSWRFRYHLDSDISKKFTDFVSTIFDGSMTEKEWEKTFEAVSRVKDAGYIGLLQKVIVTRAKCVLFVGGGAFQRHALHLYKQLHPNPEDQCIRVVKSCTNSAKFA